jgi:hypothetical protein
VIDLNEPWEYDHTFRAIFDASGTTVTFLPTRHDPARARLLLASPRLLAMLKGVASIDPPPLQPWGDYKFQVEIVDVARALIAEIEGDEPDREEYPDHGPTDPSATSGPGGET